MPAKKDRDVRWRLKRAKTRPAKIASSKAKIEIASPVFDYKVNILIEHKHRLVSGLNRTKALLMLDLL